MKKALMLLDDNNSEEFYSIIKIADFFDNSGELLARLKCGKILFIYYSENSTGHRQYIVLMKGALRAVKDMGLNAALVRMRDLD